MGPERVVHLDNYGRDHDGFRLSYIVQDETSGQDVDRNCMATNEEDDDGYVDGDSEKTVANSVAFSTESTIWLDTGRRVYR